MRQSVPDGVKARRKAVDRVVAPTRRDGVPMRLSRTPVNQMAALWLTVACGIVFVALRWPYLVTVPVNPFDEGLQLSSGAFVARGLVPFRDFYIPYGPANAYILAALDHVGFDGILAVRGVFLGLNALVISVGSYVVLRRIGPLAALVYAAVIAAYPPSSTYSGVVLLILVAFGTAIGWRQDTRIAPLVDDPTSSNDRRLLAVGVLVAMAVWFRWEMAAILVVWLSMVIWQRRSRLNLRIGVIAGLPIAISLGPYALIALSGGAPHMISALRYAVFGYPRYRSVPFSWGAPRELALNLLGLTSGASLSDSIALGMSYSVVAVGLLVLIIGFLADRTPNHKWLRLYDRDDSQMIIIVGATAGILLASLRTRPDVSHASQLFVLGWLPLFWNRLRYREVRVALALSAGVLLLLAIQPWNLDEVDAAIDRFAAGPGDSIVRSTYMSYGSDEQHIRNLVDGWGRLQSDRPELPEAIFVANRSNDLTHSNAAIVYWLLDAPPAHWLTVFDPGFADGEREQMSMISALCDTGATVVLKETVRGPEHPSGRRFSNKLDEFLDQAYVTVYHSDRYDILVPAASDCSGFR